MRRLVLATAALGLWAGAACAQVVVAPSNPAIAYSPYTWNVGNGSATTISAGAYFRVLFTGTSVSLAFNVSAEGSPASELYTRVDGYETQSPWTEASVAATVTPTMPSNTSAAPWHLLEVVVKSTSETLARWSTSPQTAVSLTGITLASGAAVVAPQMSSCTVLLYGDSITEGVRTVNSTAANDTDRNDAMQGWAYAQRGLLGCEVGIVGFGATGLTVAGSGSVPALPSAFALLYPGAPRSFSPPPDLIVLNEGTNDQNASAAAVSAALQQVLAGLLAATPASTRIAVLRPFGGFQAAALQAGIAAAGSPRVFYVDTTGFFNTAFGVDSTGLHPTGVNDLGLIAPQVSNALRALLPGRASAPTFGGQF